MKLADRFWSKVDIGTDCWTWSAYRWPKGYGCFWLDGRSQRAHRVAYILANGPIPDGLYVCHRCDNPPCVNPHHLFLGMALENSKDMVRKDRGPQGLTHGRHTKPERTARGTRNGSVLHPESRPRGEHHGQAKLTEADVRAIRGMKQDDGWSNHRIARKFGVAASTIRKVCIGTSWSHVKDLDAGAPAGGSAPPEDTGAQVTKPPRRTRGRGRPIRRWNHADDANRQS